MAGAHFRMRYMGRFSCLADACPDNCCRDWDIPVDRPALLRVQKAAGNGALRVRLDAAVKEENGALSLKPGPEHLCHLLEPNGLCAVHREHGEDILFDTCALFPRRHNDRGGDHELTGDLGCPEVSHLLLSQDDAATVEPAAATDFKRGVMKSRVGANETDPYRSQLNRVRGVMLQILSTSGLSASERLFVMASFAKRTAAGFHRTAATSQPPEQILAALEKAIGRTMSPALLVETAQTFRAVDKTSDLVPRLVAICGQVAMRAPRLRAFSELVAQVFEAYADLGKDHRAVSERHRLRCQALRNHSPQFSRTIDRYVKNVACNFWLQSWYLSSADLLAHSNRLLLDLAVWSFLFVGHPQNASFTTKARASGAPAVLGPAAEVAQAMVGSEHTQNRATAQLTKAATDLNAAASDSLYRVSRALGHSELRQQLEAELDAQGVPAFALAVQLIGFVV